MRNWLESINIYIPRKYVIVPMEVLAEPIKMCVDLRKT
jgi:hypothetical protein